MTFKRDAIPNSFAFELSNRCNYAQHHPECPTEAKADPVFLNTDIMKDVIKYLGSVGYAGTLYFNLYNEPLIDPRLFMLLEYTKEHCGCCVCIYTNGWNLNQYMVDELDKLNVVFRISYYTDREQERLSKLKFKRGSSRGNRVTLDPEVKMIYENSSTERDLCFFPSVYVVIVCTGEYILCCRDYKHHHVFGNLNTTPIKEILESDYRQRICDELEVGKRRLDLCKRCTFRGWGVKNGKYEGRIK